MFATEQCSTKASLATFEMSTQPVVFASADTLGGSSQVSMTFSRQDLVASHLDMVRPIARRLLARLPQHIELDELVAAGNLGLVDAASKFDVHRQVEFRSYAQFRIRGAMIDLLREMDWSPRILRKEGRALDEAVRELRSKGVQSPLESHIASHMGMELGAFHKLVHELDLLQVRSLNQNWEESSDDEVNDLPGPESDDPLVRCLAGERRERLIDAVDLLPERERVLLGLYYYEELPMKQIAVVLGLSESRISQLHLSALSRMRIELGGMQSSNSGQCGNEKTFLAQSVSPYVTQSHS